MKFAKGWAFKHFSCVDKHRRSQNKASSKAAAEPVLLLSSSTHRFSVAPVSSYCQIAVNKCELSGERGCMVVAYRQRKGH